MKSESDALFIRIMSDNMKSESDALFIRNNVRQYEVRI